MKSQHPNITYMELTKDYIRCPSCETAMVPFQKTDEYKPNDHKQIIGNVEITCHTIRHLSLCQCPKCFKIWKITLTDEHWSKKEK
jgi:hypothetical protein